MSTAVIDNKVRQVVSNIRNLPTPPIVFHQIQKVINDSKVSAGQIAGILSEDPAMSVKVLKLTNSAFYGLSREIESVKQAVVIVGLEAIKNLVLSASVLDMFKGKDIDQDFQEKFWRHSLAVGFCGRILARKVKSRGMIDPDSAFSGGLLHDIGKMVLSCFLTKEHKAIEDERLIDQKSQTFQVEEKVLGYNHAQIGAILAETWKLPQRLTEAVAFHHCPQLSESEAPVSYIIHIADYVAKKTFYDNDEQYLIGELVEGVQEYMQVSNEDLDTYCELLREEYLKAETFMKMAGIS
ncbi:MAG: hypothetical protein DRP45_03430 [Candidatus Zixiibacteriota bacterium]|nr:MAG: hypothetical protein DRP45_03430 [candidate division Zixibacteria bacterium]